MRALASETVYVRGVEYVALVVYGGKFKHPQMDAKLVRLQRVSNGKVVFGKNS